MADWYVWSGATGAGDGTNWANAYTTLQAAVVKPAGDVFFVAHDHSQTQGSALTITFLGTEASPNRVYCVNRAGSVPPVSADLRTTAQIAVTGAFNITLAGSVSECYGIIFNAGSAASAATINVGNTVNRTWRLVNCSLRLLNTSASSRIVAPSGSAGNVCVLENTTLQFGAVGQIANSAGRTIWRNTPSAILGTVPTTLCGFNTASAAWFLEGVDLSAATSGKTIIQANNVGPNLAVLKDCKLGAAVTVAAAPTTTFGGVETTMIRCDSDDTNYRTEKYSFMGTLVTETAIVRTGGASDGTTPISWKIVTTASSRWEFPFECLPIIVWNETTGSPVTLTLQGIWGGGAVPNNDDIWIDMEYLGTVGFPLGLTATSNKANGLVTGTALPAGTGTWGGSTTKFAMSATVTPQEKGPITIYVRAAKVSSTFYVDPKPVLT